MRLRLRTAAPARLFGRAPTGRALGLSALVFTACQRACAGDPRTSDGFQEHVLVYQDGLNLWWRGQPVVHRPVCGDSYDLGDRAFSDAGAPLWVRLRQGFGAQATRPGSHLDRALFPQTVPTAADAPVPIPTYRAAAGP